MIRAGIIGATGYAGGELVRLLAGHKEVEVVWFGSRSYQEIPYTNVYQNLFQIVEGTCGGSPRRSSKERRSTSGADTGRGLPFFEFTSFSIEISRVVGYALLQTLVFFFRLFHYQGFLQLHSFVFATLSVVGLLRDVEFPADPLVSFVRLFFSLRIFRIFSILYFFIVFC